MNAPTRWRRVVPLASFVAMLLWLTLAPFDLTWRPLVDASLRGTRVEWVPFTYACPAPWYWCLYDRLVNIVGFVPLGVLGTLLRIQSDTPARGRVRLVTGCAFALSLSIETVQFFLPSRFPSTADVALNTLGAWLGAIAVDAARSKSAHRCARGH